MLSRLWHVSLVAFNIAVKRLQNVGETGCRMTVRLCFEAGTVAGFHIHSALACPETYTEHDMKHLFRKALTASAVALFVATAFAQYPNRPITLIVPWGAGGGTDYNSRTMGALLEKELKQPVTIINRTGGSGVVGTPRLPRLLPTATPSVR